jgi:tetratricopeptide (TPR) repeat protein
VIASGLGTRGSGLARLAARGSGLGARDSGLATRGSVLAARGSGLARLAARGSGLAILMLALASPCEASLTGAAQLSAVYDSILDARFDRAGEQLKQACPPAPAEACQILGVVALWWRIQINPDNRADDRVFNERAAAAIAAADRWTRREPHRAEAWFYLAGAYAPFVQWQLLRGERVAAARNGNRIRAALERTLALDPTLADAHFGIGLYYYYADVVSVGAKLIRWLLLLPGGDRAKGLNEMSHARAQGELMRGEADYQLHHIYAWYERRPQEAITLLRSLDERYPANPLFLQRIAETYDMWLHDTRASADAWQTLADRASRGGVYDASRIARLAEMKRRAIITREQKK